MNGYRPAAGPETDKANEADEVIGELSFDDEAHEAVAAACCRVRTEVSFEDLIARCGAMGTEVSFEDFISEVRCHCR